MTKLLVKFVVLLENYEYPDYQRRYGPLFSKWLPDGIGDAIPVEIDSDTKISYWFERYGCPSCFGTMIEFNYEKKEVEPNTMKRQAVLDAGPLWGLVEIEDVPAIQIDAILQNKVGNEDYIKIGKRVVKTIYPQTKKLLNILTVTYGQYWLMDFKSWDSRRESLGNYCSSIQMQWSIDNGDSWEKFKPSESTIYLNGSIGGGDKWQYITQDDWANISKLLLSDFTPSIASTVLIKAHKHQDSGEIRYAFIEAVTALELAMEERVTQKFQENPILLKNLEDDRFWKLPMPTKLTIITSLLGIVSQEELQEAIDVVNIRNELMHEAKDLPNNAEKKLKSLMNVVSKVLVGPDLRFPAMNAGNRLDAPNNGD